MANPFFDRRHISEYLLYGGLAAVLYSLTVWYYLWKAEYESSWIAYLGSGLFMLVIMWYNIRLTQRRSDYKSAVKMMFAGHLAAITGVMLSVIISMLLCYSYIPGFMSGDSQDAFLDNAPAGLNVNNSGTLLMIFLPATIGNLGAGAFISLVISYVIKPDQTKDKPAPIV
ncbi:hypothetical protein [Sediminibacterium ginsengisoli]|uniref:DUF4199 domain-containing protein n=1 Tax=Sediminibacterium ginsengisoli TaxID=413434 RepID=A0A1T4RRJ4_9BACT|nr:hypothetical protein [Sediminibacterium ginsengisoli]SKA18584.1 hypothetical protein SAMN04488132_11426 [Sediminibacterium ginsengisoli]